MKLSVILPTFNRLQQLRQVISSLEQQDFPLNDFEVVIVSDGSSDGTNGFIKSIVTPLQLIPIFQKNAGPAAARNHGVSRAKGEYILFIDDDVVATTYLLSEHLKFHQKSKHDVVVLGPMLTPSAFPMKPWVNWEQDMLIKQYNDMVAGKWQPTARQFYTGNTSLKRKHILAARGFNVAFRRGEDVEMAYRLADQGLQFTFNPKAVGYHYADRSFKSWLSTPYTYGRNDVIMTRDKKQKWLLPTLLQEYFTRKKLIRTLTRLCLGRLWLTRILIYLLNQMAWLGNRFKQKNISRYAYSGIFNLRYYQGVADELGGRKIFFSLADKAKRSHSIVYDKRYNQGKRSDPKGFPL